MNRALYGVVNVGHEADEVPARGLFTVTNIGHEAVEVLSRALYGITNIGVYSVLLMRALYEYLAVVLRTGGDDPLEIQLVENDLTEIIHILRGK